MKMKVFKRSLFGLMAVLLTFGIGMNVKAVTTMQQAVKTIEYDQNKFTGAQTNFILSYKLIPVEARLSHTDRQIVKDFWNYQRIKEIRVYIDNGVYY